MGKTNLIIQVTKWVSDNWMIGSMVIKNPFGQFCRRRLMSDEPDVPRPPAN
jgi:hypothetical protein